MNISIFEREKKKERKEKDNFNWIIESCYLSHDGMLSWGREEPGRETPAFNGRH